MHANSNVQCIHIPFFLTQTAVGKWDLVSCILKIQAKQQQKTTTRHIALSTSAITSMCELGKY